MKSPFCPWCTETNSYNTALIYMIGRGCFGNFRFPPLHGTPISSPPPAKTTNSTAPEHLTSRRPYFIALSPLPSRNPRLLIHRRTIAHSLPAASTSPDLLLRPHLPLPPPLETSRLLIQLCTTAHSMSDLSTTPDLLRRYRRASAAAHSYSPPEMLRPHPPEPPHRRPRRRPLILFADTFLNPTGAASPTPS